ncbi:MAG: TonB family protein [Deltaproteobacteria bacterium]|nr:TonB family protein [Deltaproteobacteria bacterium]
MSRRRHLARILTAWLVSILGHLVISGVAAELVPVAAKFGAMRLPPPGARWRDGEVAIELVAGPSAGAAEPERAAPPPSSQPVAGGPAVARPDTGQAGRGGTQAVQAPAFNLADRADELQLSPALRSHVDRSQVARRRDGSQRSSPEDWSSAERPMVVTFEADGAGARQESRPAARFDPAGGAAYAGRPAVRGPHARVRPGSDAPRELAAPAPPGSPSEGGDRLASPGTGLADAAPGRDTRPSAAVATGRPLVSPGPRSAPAEARGLARDTADAEQEVESPRQALAFASTAGGLPGEGMGGVAAPGSPGFGGSEGPGSVSAPLGSGQGGMAGIDPRHARRLGYLRAVAAKIQPLWADAFPTWAALQGLQGMTVIRFVVAPDGSVASAAVVRPSGIAEFDYNCRLAVLRGAPYGPLPPELFPALHWSLSFTAENPAVRPPWRRGDVPAP